jgi:hypothetical protein
MRLPLYILLGLLLVGALALVGAHALVPSAQTQEGKKPDEAAKGKERTHSKLWGQFDPKLTTASKPYFARIDGKGSIGTHIQFGDSPDIYNTICDVQGTISNEKLKQLLTALKADLHNRAKASGLEKVGEPTDKLADRPISVLSALYRARRIMPLSVHGFYLTYTDGKVVGAIDVGAALDSDAIDHWVVACAVHEVFPE